MYRYIYIYIYIYLFAVVRYTFSLVRNYIFYKAWLDIPTAGDQRFMWMYCLALQASGYIHINLLHSGWYVWHTHLLTIVYIIIIYIHDLVMSSSPIHFQLGVKVYDRICMRSITGI